MKKINLQIVAILIGLTMISPNLVIAQKYGTTAIEITDENNNEIINLEGKPGSHFIKTLTISNHSADNVLLNLYASDATLEKSKFLLNSNQKLGQLGNNIKIEDKTLELAGNTSKKITVEINLPNDIGVGKHYAAIMTSQKTSGPGENIVNIEKGIRLYVNVVGKANSQFKLINVSTEETADQSTYSGIIYNSGNTNLQGEINFFDQNLTTVKQQLTLKPGQEENLKFQIPKPQFGSQKLFTKLTLGNYSKTSLLTEIFIFPKELLLLVLLTLIAALYLNIKKKTAEEYILINEKTGHETFSKSNRLIIFALLSAAVGISIFANSISNSLFFKADLLNNISTPNYVSTIKWGNLYHNPLPDSLKINWSGSLKISSGQIVILDRLHLEDTDQFYLNSSSNTLYFRNVTGPDNDGLILLIRPDFFDSKPSITYRNNLTNEEIIIPINNTIEKTRFIDYKQHQIGISSQIASTKVDLNLGNQTVQIYSDGSSSQSQYNNEQSINDLESTSEVGGIITDALSTAEILAQEEKLKDEISLLREVIKEIPASTDLLSEYILNSAHVEEVVTENNSVTVTSDSLLIDRLQESPLTISEITATPDLNFVFVPNEKVTMAPQQFSFNETQNSSQELGDIILVQNKTIPWSTYITVTNLNSTSGNYLIPAENISIKPGLAKVISQNGAEPQIQTGPERRLFNSNDKLELVSISPQGEGETIFSINPKILISIPAGTPPGIYRAEYTIKII